MALSDDNLTALRVAHLGMIQGVINRMSGFSASAKTFLVTILAGLAAISLQADSMQLGVIGMIAAAILFLIDTYYMTLEVRFRAFYDRVVARPLADAEDMKIAPVLSAGDKKKAITSKSNLLFYMPVLFACILFIVYGAIHEWKPDDFLEEILRALGNPSAPSPSLQQNALSGLFNPSPPQGTLGGLMGNPPPRALNPFAQNPPQALGGLFGLKPQATAPANLPAPAPHVRRVFYSFHYADVNRVNQVRQSGKIRAIDSERVKTVQDRSLWERRKSINEEYLRRSISKNIAGTSATCILTGEDTWARPWCRFEIARSLLNGNGIFAVRIDHLWCIGQRCYGNIGPNPLDFMAVGRDAQGRIYVYEYVDDGWYKMASMSKQLMRWPRWLAPVTNGYVQLLSTGAPIYDYDSQNGSRLLLYWANQAAKEAGR